MNPYNRYLRKQRKNKERAQIKALWEDYCDNNSDYMETLEVLASTMSHAQSAEHTIANQHVAALWGQNPTTDKR